MLRIRGQRVTFATNDVTRSPNGFDDMSHLCRIVVPTEYFVDFVFEECVWRQRANFELLRCLDGAAFVLRLISHTSGMIKSDRASTEYQCPLGNSNQDGKLAHSA